MPALFMSGTCLLSGLFSYIKIILVSICTKCYCEITLHKTNTVNWASYFISRRGLILVRAGKTKIKLLCELHQTDLTTLPIKRDIIV